MWRPVFLIPERYFRRLWQLRWAKYVTEAPPLGPSVCGSCQFSGQLSPKYSRVSVCDDGGAQQVCRRQVYIVRYPYAPAI